MNIEDIKVGDTYTYYPPREGADDNRHWPALCERVGRVRVRVRIFAEGHPDGVVRSVSPSRLVAGQGELV